jgi:biopolymer transport protein ExbB
VFVLETDWIIAIPSFFDAGGSVLWAIFVATGLMWTMIVERAWFFRTSHKQNIERATKDWAAHKNQPAWHSQAIRRELMSRVSLQVNRYIRIIHILMVLLPLLGLLGTVTGMIQVFNVMAMDGSTNPRLMAAGVSAATIPTMAGLVAALSGFWFTVYFKRRARAEIQRVDEMLAGDP